jgi:hypothetical protein
MITINAHRLWQALALLGAAALLGACAGPAPEGPLPHYLCEQNTQFTARFEGDSVRLDSNRGYDLLFKKPGSSAAVYESAQVSVEFNLGSNSKEAVLRYPLLPLALRCVRTN